MNNAETKIRRTAGTGTLASLLSVGLLSAAATYAPVSYGGATFKIDDTKWISIGAGIRSSFTATEGAADGKWSNDFNLDNARIYINGQIHKYVKLEFNTECFPCTSSQGGDVMMLDAIAKFEIMPEFNLWVGRQLVAAERRELNGPFYSAIYNTFGGGTPFEPSDLNVRYFNDGTSAGAIGRDDGANIWGAFFEGRLQYVAGFFRGLRGGANKDDNILYAQRVSYNFLDVEKNPGYYTSGTYYGKGGDIFTVGVANQYQEDGAGIAGDAGTFRGTSVDVLYEQNLPENMGVITFNGEYKNYGITGFDMTSRQLVQSGAVKGFPLFEGNAFDLSLMYLMPQKVWIGQFQPYIRYTDTMPVNSTNRNLYEAGVNYIIDGHNARVSLMYMYGDLLTKGNFNFTDTAKGDSVSQIMLGVQLQI
ncbi:hypothetical protein [Methyloterricola oryzae]|uniref:hypothetical protein n=1 Tax=Methyloterricola oryzae TaxID=1495050 RepID=UPI0005EB677E|nr:hypothetical protein [Methyloterricola oryzae]